MAEQDHRPPQALEAIEREKQCWALRLHGYTYEQIATELGLGTRTAAWHAVKKAFDRYREEIREDAFHYIQQQNDQIDMLMQVYFERARSGDLQAALFVNKLWERRSSLNGLDAPKKNELADKNLPVRFIVVHEKARQALPDANQHEGVHESDSD